jgi:hypothetical protein
MLEVSDPFSSHAGPGGVRDRRQRSFFTQGSTRALINCSVSDGIESGKSKKQLSFVDFTMPPMHQLIRSYHLINWLFVDLAAAAPTLIAVE